MQLINSSITYIAIVYYDSKSNDVAWNYLIHQ